MSTIPIASQSSPGNSTFQCIKPGNFQKITTSGTSQQSSAFAATTSVVYVYATADTFLAFGSNPTASSSTHFLPLGTIQYYMVDPATKLAAIQSTASGTLYISEAL